MRSDQAVEKRVGASLITGGAGVLFATGAQAQDAVKACRQLKDEAERLKCYDRLDTSASNAPRGQRESKPDGETGWIVNDEKSPLDDSPLVSAALTSGDSKTTLLMRCKHRTTEAAVSIRGFITSASPLRLIYRVDQAQPTQPPWN